MHIHKPKELHGWRAFAGEVGVIVIGILIALALEQTVEWINWHEQSSRTEAAFQAELKYNFLFAYERRVVDPCVRKRIAFLRDKLLEPGPHWDGAMVPTVANDFYKQPPMPSVLSMPFRPRRMEAWQTALASGVLNHMPSDRVTIYARIYDQVGLLKETQDEELTAVHQIGGLAFTRELSPSDRTSYLDRLAYISNLNRLIVGQSGQLIHAPFTLGADTFHISQADATAAVERTRPVYGTCVTAEAVPTPQDPASSFWFTTP